MHINWDDIRWLQNAPDLSTNNLYLPLPLIKAALSVLEGTDERTVITRSILTDDAESWTLMALDGNALVHVGLSYNPPRPAAGPRENDRADEEVDELRAIRVHLRDVHLTVRGVPATGISLMSRAEPHWLTNFVISAPSVGIDEEVDVSRVRFEYGQTAAEQFHRTLVSALAAL